VADAVVLSLVAVAVPVELDEVPLVELVEPDGGGGGVDGGGDEVGAAGVADASLEAAEGPSEFTAFTVK
jgi:hypothetical protein